jgi:hypothetical protein
LAVQPGAGPCFGEYLLGQRQLALKPALSIGLQGINVDLRLVDEVAFRAPQGPVLKAGTRRDRSTAMRAWHLGQRGC